MMNRVVHNILVLGIIACAFPSLSRLIAWFLAPLTPASSSAPGVLAHIIISPADVIAPFILGFAASGLLSPHRKWLWLVVLPALYSCFCLLTSSVSDFIGIIRRVMITLYIIATPFAFLLGAVVHMKLMKRITPNRVAGSD